MSNSIPSSWKKSNLGEVLFVQGGNAFKSEDFSDSGIPVIRISNIKQGQVDLSSAIYTKESKAFSKFEVAYGDVLVAMSGATTGKIGRFRLAETAYINQRVGRLLIKNDKSTSLDFIYHVGTTDDFLGRLLIDAMGGAQPNISNQSIEALRLDLPSFPEQQKIAAILTSVDDVIESTQAQINKLKDLKTGMMQELLTKGIGHTEFKDSPVGRIPVSWMCVPMNKIAKVTDGAHFTPTYTESGVPFLRVTDLKNKNIIDGDIKYIPRSEHEELIKRCKPERGDILFSKNGTIGLTRLIDWDDEFSIFVSLALIKIQSEQITPEYLTLFMESPIVKEQIKRRSKQGSVTNLHLEEIREFDIPLPSKSEQENIVKMLRSIIKKIEFIEEKHNLFVSTKKALMQDLLTGKVRVKVN